MKGMVIWKENKMKLKKMFQFASSHKHQPNFELSYLQILLSICECSLRSL